MSSEPISQQAPATVARPSAGLWANLMVMWRVVFALMMRDSRTRYGGSDLGYLWAIIDPMVQMLVLILVFTAFGRRVPVPETSLPVFFTVGILPYQFWKNSVQRGASASRANVPLLTYPQVKVMDVVVARVLLDFATLIAVLLIFVVALHYVTGEPFSSWDGDPLQIVLSFITLLYFSFSFAVFSCNLGRVFPIWPEIFGYLSRPLWFTSGIFFTLQGLTKGFRQVAVFNPVAHMLEWIKSAILPAFHSTVYSPSFIYVVATLVLFTGLTIEWFWRLTGHADETD